ncbi:MAG: ArsR family transcriptional regulator [Methanomicrobia archaeon]|nr:ArsR family transcriptional regulator [Methanomicrobia archaeon]MCK4433003.1 ArsR family transcriptional regulator [Methanomicrobia archaeon]
MIIMPRFKIVIKDEELPFERNVDKYVEFLCNVLGLSTGRDTDDTTCKVFKKIVIHSSREGVTTTKEICEEINMSRGAVVNQINKMIEAGMLRKEGNYYVLRRRNLIRTMWEIREDILRMFEKIEEIAEELDEEIGLPKERR